MTHRIGDPAFQWHPTRNRSFRSNNDKTASTAAKKNKRQKKGGPGGGDDDGASLSDEYEEQVVVLKAGSVLYHPAGIWHRVESLDDSLAINVGSEEGSERWRDGGKECLAIT